MMHLLEMSGAFFPSDALQVGSQFGQQLLRIERSHLAQIGPGRHSYSTAYVDWRFPLNRKSHQISI